MLFPEEDAPHLKAWIVKRLENTSDADADVLADYVLALLRHDGDVKDVRKLCEEEIPDFLKEDSSVFVSDVFDALAYRSYLPGAPPPPPKHALSAPAPASAAAAAARPSPSMYDDDTPMAAAPAYQSSPLRNGRKRGYNDWDDPNAQNGRDGGFGARAFKQPRRGGIGGRVLKSDDVSTYSGVPPAMPPYPPAGQLPPPGPPRPATVGYFDPNVATDGMFGMSLATGHPMPELLAHGRGHLPPKQRKKCRDWERKGYCQRGSSCMFEHSNDPIYPPLPGPPFDAMQRAPQPAAVEEYDPTNALMPDIFSGSPSLPGQQPPPHTRQPPRSRGGKQQNRQRRGEKAPFSADGPVFDRSKSTIVVENIPEENFSEDQVRDFFSQFGNILEVSMQPYKRLAIVKFDSWNSANAAYQSPKVIFENRFVKVFWYKDDQSVLPASSPLTGGVASAKRMHTTNGSSAAGGHHTGTHADMDLEEFARKQEEKQKAFEEKARKREELERQRQELEKRQQELIAKQLEEKAKLEAKLAARNGTAPGDDNGDAKSSKPLTQTEALRAQLAALEAEARQMGLDPDAVTEAPSPWPSRGGSYGYGRGRGGWRGSSPYTPRGSYRGAYRGAYRGRANVHAAYAAYSLDNRPKKVVLTGVDFTAPDKDETLRQYLFGIGEFTGIQTTAAATEITFKDRKTAEKFFNSVVLNGKEIPGLEGFPVELAWAGGPNSSAPSSAPATPGGGPSTPGLTTTASGGSRTAAPGAGTAPGASTAGTTTTTATARPTKTTTTSTATATGTGTERGEGEGGDGHGHGHGDGDDAASSSGDKDVHILLDRPPQDLDYEVADENQWGY